ncbi:MAG TPA: hypothetical protein VEI25_15200 [Paraburkholderia sp.]|nr:hypothetical protein [Paraburkholderia sp.]
MKANIFQIFHDESGRSQLDPGFAALDNTANLRPDWHDYWAVRNFFRSQSINDDELYGFLSSDFGSRTALNAQSVHAFIEANPGYEVYTFSPSTEEGACYLNVFEHGNVLHPGLIEAAEAYLREIELDVDLRSMAADSRSTVSGYYVVAKPSFWQTWFALTEKLFDLCEGEDGNTAFRDRLASLAVCGTGAGIRRLIVERIASLVLALCPDIEVCAFDPESLPLSKPAYRKYTQQIALLNDLKAGASESSDTTRLNNFYALRGAVLQACEGKRSPRASEGFMATALVASPEMLYVCFTHVPLQFQFPSYVSTLSLGDVQGPGKTNLRDLAPEWEPYHPQIGSLAGCFALKNYIVENKLQVRHVGMCQYRKFVSNVKIGGVPAANFPIMDVLNRHTVDEASLNNYMLPGDRDFLLVKPGMVNGGYLNQYNRAHVTQDFLRFTAEAVELGVLPGTEAMPFFSSDAFMTGGVELGVFPTAFWIRAISSIEMVVRACVTRYPGKRAGYQARNWAFCVERLGSYLLLKHLTTHYDSNVWQQQFVGQLNLLTEDEKAVYVAGR